MDGVLCSLIVGGCCCHCWRIIDEFAGSRAGTMELVMLKAFYTSSRLQLGAKAALFEASLRLEVEDFKTCLGQLQIDRDRREDILRSEAESASILRDQPWLTGYSLVLCSHGAG